MNYSSTTGMITNSMWTPINASLAGALCWSTYSPTIGNYYVIGSATATIVELNINLSSNSSPVTIVQYYQLPNNTGALEATVVSLAGNDYLYVLGTTTHAISSYQLRAAGNATANGIVLVHQGDTTNLSKLAGIATFLQTRSSAASSAMSLLTLTMTTMIHVVFIFSGGGQDI